MVFESLGHRHDLGDRSVHGSGDRIRQYERHGHGHEQRRPNEVGNGNVDAADFDNPNVVKPVVSWEVGKVYGRALYFSRGRVPSGKGDLYHHIGIYAFRRAALARFVSLSLSPLERRENLEQLRALEDGMTIAVGLVDKPPLSVDTPDDLARVREAARQQSASP